MNDQSKWVPVDEFARRTGVFPPSRVIGKIHSGKLKGRIIDHKWHVLVQPVRTSEPESSTRAGIVHCRGCGEQIEIRAEKCPKCGQHQFFGQDSQPIDKERTSKGPKKASKAVRWSVFILVASFLSLMTFSWVRGPSNTSEVWQTDPRLDISREIVRQEIRGAAEYEWKDRGEYYLVRYRLWETDPWTTIVMWK